MLIMLTILCIKLLGNGIKCLPNKMAEQNGYTMTNIPSQSTEIWLFFLLLYIA